MLRLSKVLINLNNQGKTIRHQSACYGAHITRIHASDFISKNPSNLCCCSRRISLNLVMFDHLQNNLML